MPQQYAAVITGASRGIGRALALALASSGVTVGLLARNAQLLDAVVSEVKQHGGLAFARAADVTNAVETNAAVQELVLELESTGAVVTLLVNAAGRIDREVALWEADPVEWRNIVETNLVGSFHVSNAVIPHMLRAIEAGKAQQARVIELASGAGAKDWSKASAYTASKAGVIRMVGHLHEAGFELGLRSFAVAPGTVKTDMSTSMTLHADRKEFTPVELTENMVLAINRGELDEWSGKYLRVTHDSPQSLAAHALQFGSPSSEARRLAIVPWGDDDPQRTESMTPKLG